MERDPYSSGSDVGSDIARDVGDEPRASIRDAPPDYLGQIDPNAPVSGHVPASGPSTPVAEAPEHDWTHARDLIVPAFRPVGTTGLPIEQLDATPRAPVAGQGSAQPVIDEGPAGIPVVYTIAAGGFDIVVNRGHLESWGVGAEELQDAAIGNLARWSASAPWTDEVSGDRRLMSSDTGEGCDAVRILLPDVRGHLANELGGHGRVLVGIPERHLLIAGTLRPEDAEFAALFADFVVEHSGGADEPIDRRVFELVDGQLVEFVGVAAGA